MNFLKLGIIPISLAIAACETMNQPTSVSSFDPLKPPGGSVQEDDSSDNYSELTPGQFVIANVPNTAFYNKKPKSGQDADQLLAQGTQMKIVSLSSNMAKVELDSGAVGFVPAVMVSGKDSDSEQDLFPVDGTYQIYPALPGGGPLQPLPVIDLEGLPPEGAIPTIIDPDAPAETPSAPTLDTIPTELPTPATVEEKAKDKVQEKAEEELDPVAEAVREKIAEAMKEEAEAAEKAADSLKEAAE